MKVRPSAHALSLVLGLTILLPLSAEASDARIQIRAKVEPETLAAGERGRLRVDIDVPSGFHLWGLDPGPGPLPLAIQLEKGSPLALEGAWFGAEPKTKFDRGFQRELRQYEGAVHLERVAHLTREVAPGEVETLLVVRGQICTEEVCVAQREEVKLQLTVSKAPARAASATPNLEGAPLSERAAIEAAPVAAVGPGPKKTAAEDEILKMREKGALPFMLLAFLFGLGALATPCVFPAIPLTVSFFTKYSEESFGRGARLAFVYATTMVASFTGLGILISVLFGVTGIQRFASHPVFNLSLAVLLIFFALNLLGLFEIKVPAFALDFVNRLESKYGRASSALPSSGQARRSGITDYVVVSIAAVTATTVFFTCTVAFVGLVLVAAARGEWFWPTLGMVSFASAFALPFFLLAMFPQAARRLRGKAGNWLSMTRVTLGFLEAAAAMKFLSNADLRWTLHLLTRDVVLAVWIPLFALCGLYLLGKLKLGDEADHGADGKSSVAGVFASTLMFAMSIYLAAGLFNGRPFGGWIDGWLPPLEYPGDGPSLGEQAGSKVAFHWSSDLEAARAEAAKSKTLLFVNYTGYTCTNCRYMEGGVFPRPEIASLLKTMTLVELYTDGGADEHERNRNDQVARFGTAALPLYSVERPDGTILGTFASSTNDPAEFHRFLTEAVAKGSAPVEVQPAANLLAVKASRLSDGTAAQAIVPGKWTLINLWASWCGPCREELKSFLIESGLALESSGGRFLAIAVDADETVAAARAQAEEMKLPAASSLRVTSEKDLDPRFGFDGSDLPYTVLVSPAGEVVWKHAGRLEHDDLKNTLACFVHGEGQAPAEKTYLALAQKCAR